MEWLTTAPPWNGLLDPYKGMPLSYDSAHAQVGGGLYVSDNGRGQMASTVFAANTSCILSPEVTDGPYYVLGEMIRKNVTEGQPGIPLYLEVQYIDISTCEPVPEVYVDIWNCNSTGYYR